MGVEEVYIYMHGNPLGNEKWEEMGDSLSICIYIYIYTFIMFITYFVKVLVLFCIVEKKIIK